MRKLTHEDFIERLLEKSDKDNKIEILSQYKGSKIKVNCKCKDCGFEWKATPNNLLRGHGCPRCATLSKRSRKTHEEFINELLLINSNIIILSKYCDPHEKVKCYCTECGNTWFAFPYSLLQKRGCPRCAINIRRKSRLKTHDKFIEEFTTKNPHADEIDIIGRYQTNNIPILCHCKICNNDWEMKPYYLTTRLYGCPVCINKRIIQGVNDIATTHPDLIKYFVNKDDTIKYSYGSKQKCLLECPLCGYQKEQVVADLVNRGFSCSLCNDKGYSYPNRFAYAFLDGLPIEEHIREYSPEWISPKRYDNYFEYQGQKYILEMDGGLHYRNAFGRTSEDVQKVDEYKNKLAKEHGITVIRIECKQSSGQYIKNKIIKSELNNIFDLSDYDWDNCFIKAKNKSYIPIWEYLNTHLEESLQDVGNIFGKTRQQMRRIVWQGQEIGMCYYKIHSPKKIMVYKDDTLLYTFNSLQECKRSLCRIYSIPITIEKVKDACEGIIELYKGFTFKYAQTDERSVI